MHPSFQSSNTNKTTKAKCIIFSTQLVKNQENILTSNVTMDDGINSQQWKEKDGRYGSEKNEQQNGLLVK